MDKLLNREEVLIMLEKAVAWDKSVIGRTSGGIGSLFSFMRGKIKGAINKAKIRSLVTNWGAEYLNALMAVDKNLPAATTVDGNDPAATTTQPSNLSVANLDKFIASCDVKLAAVDKLIAAFTAATTWASVTNLAGYKTLKSATGEPSKILIDDAFIDSLTDFIVLDFNKEKYRNLIKDLTTLSSTILGADPKSYDNTVNAADLAKVRELAGVKGADVNSFREYFKRTVTYLNLIKTLITNAKNIALALKQSITSLDEIAKIKETYKNDPAKQTAEIDKIKARDKVGIDLLKTIKLSIDGLAPGVKTQIRKYLTELQEPIFESLIVEANEKQLPDYVQDIFGSIDPNDLEELKKVQDIKTKSAAKMNYQMLDIIDYEAKYLINQAKNSTNDKEKAEASEMQREWDLGIKSLNNYFQDLIDIDAVMKGVKSDSVGDDVKAKLTTANEKVNVLKGLQIDEQLPAAGGQFTNDNMYLFDVTFMDYKQSVKERHYIGISPVAQMVEDANGVKYYWHRIFGAYTYDGPSKKIIRTNPFTNTTFNKKLIDNFSDQENMYFLVFKERQSVSKEVVDTFIYSNKGSLIWNNVVYPKVNDVAKDAVRKIVNDPQKVYKYGNIFRLKIHARYIIDKTQIQLYPGVQIKDLTNDIGYKEAKFNHDELIKVLK